MPDTELAKRLDAAFEQWRAKTFGVHPYPIDAYTYFGAGWKAALSAARAEALREAAEKVRKMQRHYEQYLQKYPDEQVSDVRAALCESLAKQFDALAAAGQGGENG